MVGVPTSFGFPLMHLERGERRCFMPSLMTKVSRAGATQIVVEEGYGQPMGVPTQAYIDASPTVKVGSYDDCLAQDAVVQVRCPPDEVLHAMEPHTVLVAMLHYPTRPGRVALLSELGLRCISLDAIVDDLGHRLVENLRGVGWYGVRAAVRELAKSHRRFHSSGRGPLRATVLGAGAVAGHAVRACTQYGDPELHRRMTARRVVGFEVSVVDRDTTWHENTMLNRLEQTDLLVDATARQDQTQPVIPNDWIEALPQHAVILDIAADPYDFSVSPPHVKGIEGLPQGDLDQYVFPIDDPAYDLIDPRIQTSFRRKALSCYSWPGVEPRDCMEIYSRQLESVLEMLLHRPIELWDVHSGHFVERAVARAELTRWRQEHLR